MSDRFERFSVAIFEIWHCWHKIAAEVMEQHGLKGPHAIYLSIMRHHPEGITVTALGEICGRDKGDVSRSVALLESKGLLKRDGSRYRALLKLTEQGEEVAQAVYVQTEEAVERASRGYTLQQRETFYQVLETITKNLTGMCGQGGSDGEPEAE